MRWSVVARLGLLIAALSGGAADAAAKARLAVISSDPRYVAGGDVLVRYDAPEGTSTAVTFRVNGAPAHVVRQQTEPDGRSVTALIDRLSPGRNTVTAVSAGGARGQAVLQNHPATGPVLPGAAIPLLGCRTEESGLGPPTDGDCSAPTRIDYFYRSTAGAFKPLPARDARPADLATAVSHGVTVPYIVRVESGVTGRSIYRIAVLDDPAKSASEAGAWRPSAAWNGRLVVFFGGGCGGHYAQGGDKIEQVLSDAELSRGFAYAVSPSLVNQQFCSPLIQADALIMIKQHFAKAYGAPAWTLGTGASGGSIQQYAIAEMFPGLLDAIQPGASFPDSQLQSTSDCDLLRRAFAADPQRWTGRKQAVVSGAPLATCVDWSGTFAENVRAVPKAPDLSDPVAALVESAGDTRIASPFACDVKDGARLYDPRSNPRGLRCSRDDMQAGQLGRDATGAGRRPFDNVGVQYGLAALNAGDITADDFLALNAAVGGYDRDGAPTAQRAAGDLVAIRNAYATGLMNSGGGGLGRVPVITLRSYMDDMPPGHALALHDRLQDLIVRARLQRANGSSANQVIWTVPLRTAVDTKGAALDLATRWLDALVADPRPLTQAKVVEDKPADAADACWSPAGEKIVEAATLAPQARCNQLFPLHGEPRMVAGEGLTNDVMKCRLQAPARSMYPTAMTDDQFARLRAIFPQGVCDYAAAGVGQAPFSDPLSAQRAGRGS